MCLRRDTFGERRKCDTVFFKGNKLSVACLYVRPRDVWELQLFSRFKESVPIENVDALEAGLNGTIPH